MDYPGLSSGSSPLFYVLFGGGVHTPNSRAIARAYGIDPAITECMVNGTECDCSDLSPNGLPLPPACLNRQAVHSAFIALEMEMTSNITYVGAICPAVPDLDVLEDELDSSRLSGLFLYMRHRPRHVLKSPPHLWQPKASAIFYRFDDLSYIKWLKELHNLVHRTRGWWGERLDIPTQSYLLYSNALACRQNWPLKTPESEEVSKRHAGGVVRSSFNGSEYTASEYYKQMDKVDREEVFSICKHLKHNFIGYADYAEIRFWKIAAGSCGKAGMASLYGLDGVGWLKINTQVSGKRKVGILSRILLPMSRESSAVGEFVNALIDGYFAHDTYADIDVGPENAVTYKNELLERLRLGWVTLCSDAEAWECQH
eukprot:3900499-Amphidinium_carterae.1